MNKKARKIKDLQAVEIRYMENAAFAVKTVHLEGKYVSFSGKAIVYRRICTTL